MPLKIKNMKGLDFSCASPASTAICSSTDQNFMVRNSTKSLNRINSYLNDHYKSFTNYTSNHHSSTPRAPCISELPFTPRLSSSYREKTRKKPPLPSAVNHSDLTPRRKSSADIDVVRRRRYYHKCSSLTAASSSPQRSHSSRYLLGESKYLDSLSLSESHDDYDNTNDYSKKNHQLLHNKNGINSNDDSLALVPSTPVYQGNKTFGSYLDAEKDKKINKLVNPSDQRVIKSSNDNGANYDDGYIPNSMGYSRNDSLVLKKSSSSGARSRDQVVILRVSLHCKGCEGKLRKHLSKMEGVSSFSIDLETKKVTVIGSVTPVGVLTSISKVKNAQFWPSAASASPPLSSSSSSTSSSIVDFN